MRIRDAMATTLTLHISYLHIQEPCDVSKADENVVAIVLVVVVRVM